RARRSPLCPYTTLFRSAAGVVRGAPRAAPARGVVARDARGAARAAARGADGSARDRSRGLSRGPSPELFPPAHGHTPTECGRRRSEEHTSELQSRENFV